MVERLNALSQWHDTALNRDYPPQALGGADECAKFEAKALKFLSELQIELGGEFEIVYEPS